MRLKVTKSKNAASLYVIKSTYEKGRHSSKIVEKLGTEKELREKLDGADPYEWAKRYIEKMNQEEAENSRKVMVGFSPRKTIARDKQVSFHGGHLFLRSIYHKLRLDTICTEADAYTCPAGKQLRAQYQTMRKSRNGFTSDIPVYTCDACVGCAQKTLSTKAKENRTMRVSKRFDSQRRDSLARITSPEGTILRINRSIQSEGAFGVLKEDCGFRRFLRRGSTTVFTELLLFAAAFIINKLHAKRTQKRSGVFLHFPNTG